MAHDQLARQKEDGICRRCSGIKTIPEPGADILLAVPITCPDCDGSGVKPGFLSIEEEDLPELTVARRKPEAHPGFDFYEETKDFRLTSEAQSRPYIGAIGEAIVGEAFPVVPLRTDGTKDICPDFRLREDDNSYLEAKTVRDGKGAMIIYKWRLEKEQRFLQEKGARSYFYVVVGHRMTAAMHGRPTYKGLLRKLAEGVTLTLIPFEAIRAATEALGPAQPFSLAMKPPSRGNGYQRAGYREGGWRFPLTALPAFVEVGKIALKIEGFPCPATIQVAGPGIPEGLLSGVEKISK